MNVTPQEWARKCMEDIGRSGPLPPGIPAAWESPDDDATGGMQRHNERARIRAVVEGA